MTTVSFNTEPTGKEAPPPETPDFSNEPGRPEWLPSHFKTVEDYVKANEETKAALTRTQQELARFKKTGTPPVEGEEDPPKDETPPQEETPPKDDTQSNDKLDDAAQKLADEAGLDLKPFQEEYFSSGDVSEESRVKIADALKKSLGDEARAIVDDFIEARKIAHANDQKLFMDAAGGADQYKAMVEWAKDALPKEQVAVYNQQVNSGDRHAVIFAIDGLRAKYEAANGRPPPKRLTGDVPRGSVTPFASTAEMRRAMADPRYKTDQAFRDEVAARLAASDNL